MNDGIGVREHNTDQPSAWARNSHPTIKPIALTEYLARLLLPPVEYAPRRVFVPFAGAGSEAIGAMRAGWEEVVGVEMMNDEEHNYVDIARARVAYWQSKQPML
jgi:site-specific DNA-methyltransferase (adenine-specific)